MSRNALSDSQIAEYKESFAAFDSNGDGTIAKNELRRFLKSLDNDLSDEEVNIIFKTVDKNCDGFIDFPEFLLMMNATSGKGLDNDDLKEAFDQFDDDGNGQITRDELKATMSKLGKRLTLTDDQVEQILQQVDTDGDGQISFEEFRQLMTSSSEKSLEELDRSPPSYSLRKNISELENLLVTQGMSKTNAMFLSICFLSVVLYVIVAGVAMYFTKTESAAAQDTP